MDHTKKTLLEQMQISEIEIARRKALLDFQDTDAALLLSCKGLVTELIDVIVGSFYEKQTAIDEIALLIGDADTLARLHAAQHAYILNLFEGYYDLAYVNNRLRIGMVHKRIGVEPKLYLSAVKTLKDTISATLSTRIEDKAHLQQVLGALDKLLYFDVTLIFDTYIRGLLSEVEAAKDKALNYGQEMEAKVVERTRQLNDLSQRDPLTGLFNQRALNDCLRRELNAARRHGKPLALLYLDVDGFKQVNDSQGHFAGDEVLRKLADALRQTCREIDTPCRCGGDEFCLVLPDCTLADAQLVGQRLMAKFTALVPGVTLSMGLAEAIAPEFLNAQDLLATADARMYQAKAQPGFQICSG